MKPNWNELRTSDILLGVIFIVLSASTIAKSYFHPDGYITWDSANFFRIAKNLSEGNGVFVTDFFASNGKSFFASWPLGYPILLFLCSKIIPLDIFLVSKIINVLAVGGVIYFLNKLFRGQAIYFVLLLFFASFLEIFSYSLSESVFILGLLWFCYETVKYVEGGKNFLHLFGLFASTIFLFLTRYIGAINVVFLFLLFLSEIRKKNYHDAFRLFVVVFLCTICIALYLYNNHLQTGYFTGMPRDVSPQSSVELLREIAQALILQLNFIFVRAFAVVQSTATKTALHLSTLLLSLGLCFYYFRKIAKVKRDDDQEKNINTAGKIFILVGTIQILSLVFLRWFFYYGILGFRYLAPGFLLILIGVCVLLFQKYNEQQRKIFFKMVFTLAIVSWFINVPLKTFYISNNSPFPNYYRSVEHSKQKYSSLPIHSLVACADAHLLYLRTDCQSEFPLSKLHNASAETLEEFFQRLKKSNAEHLYIEINREIFREEKGFDESILEFMKQHKQETLIELKR